MRTVLGEVGVTGLGRPHLFSMSWGRARWKESGQEVSRPLGGGGGPTSHLTLCDEWQRAVESNFRARKLGEEEVEEERRRHTRDSPQRPPGRGAGGGDSLAGTRSPSCSPLPLEASVSFAPKKGFD